MRYSLVLSKYLKYRNNNVDLCTRKKYLNLLLTKKMKGVVCTSLIILAGQKECKKMLSDSSASELSKLEKKKLYLGYDKSLLKNIMGYEREGYSLPYAIAKAHELTQEQYFSDVSKARTPEYKAVKNHARLIEEFSLDYAISNIGTEVLLPRAEFKNELKGKIVKTNHEISLIEVMESYSNISDNMDKHELAKEAILKAKLQKTSRR